MDTKNIILANQRNRKMIISNKNPINKKQQVSFIGPGTATKK